MAYFPTLTAVEAYAEYFNGYVPGKSRPTAGRARRAGGNAHGRDHRCESYTHGTNAREIEWLVRGGMGSAQALLAATAVDAAILHLDHQIDRLVPGLRADIVAVQGDPAVNISAGRSTPVAKVLPREHTEYEAINAWYDKYQRQFMMADMPPVPDTKPDWRDFLIGDHGRVWVRRYTTAEHIEVDSAARVVTPRRPPQRSWVEPAVFDVFEPDGTYLGEVHVPRGVNLRVVRGERAWGTSQGENGEQVIVRLHIDHGGGA